MGPVLAITKLSIHNTVKKQRIEKACTSSIIGIFQTYFKIQGTLYITVYCWMNLELDKDIRNNNKYTTSCDTCLFSVT